MTKDEVIDIIKRGDYLDPNIVNSDNFTREELEEILAYLKLSVTGKLEKYLKPKDDDK